MDNGTYNQALAGSTAPRSVLRQATLYALERRQQRQPDVLTENPIDPVLEKLDFTSFSALERKLGLWPAVAVAQQVGTEIPPFYPLLISDEWRGLDEGGVLLSALWLDSLVNMGFSPTWQFDERERGKKLRCLDLSGLDLRRSRLSLDKVIDVKMMRSSLRESVIKGVEFARCNASHADFSECIFERVVFEDSDLRFANFSGSHRPRAFMKTDMNNVIFDNADLKQVLFSEVTVRSASFKNVNMPQSNVSLADFSGSDLSGLFAPASQFKGCRFPQVNLSDADFEASFFLSSFFSNSNLSGANLAEVNMNGVRIEHCNLTKSSFCKARLSHTSFRKVNFDEADFTEADLKTSSFDSGCSFIGVVGLGTHRSHYAPSIRRLWS